MTVVDRPPQPADLLIEEARERQRRRRRRLIAASLVAVVGAGVGIAASRGGPGRPDLPHPSAGLPAAPPVHRPVVDPAALHHKGSLAFLSRGSLWLLDASTSRLRLLAPAEDNPGPPSFSADGRWLAFTTHPRHDRGWLWLARREGNGLRRIHRHELEVDGWSPRGHRLAIDFVTSSGPVPARNLTSVATLTPRGRLRPVAQAGGLTGVVWSPDGRSLAVASTGADYPHDRTTVVTYPLAGGAATTWLSLNDRYGQLLGMDELRFSPAGWWRREGIGLWVLGNGMVNDVDQTPLVLLSAPGARPRLLARTQAGFSAIPGALGGPAETPISGSGRGALAVVAQTGRDGFGRLIWQHKRLRICPPGEACRQVPAPARTVTLDPAWSPDGRTLAYVVAPERSSAGFPNRVVRRWYAAHRLALYEPGLRRMRYVFAARGATAPMWSRDGTYLLYAARDAIWSVRPGARHATRVAGPLFGGALPAYYGQVDWVGQFAWSAAR